jgi:hypothetical protein
MPVWHASVSAQRRGRFLSDEARLERLAVAALRGVGGGHEWWVYALMLNGAAVVGHLRVPVTADEYALIPPALVTADAGETGPRRPRTP